MPSTNKLARAAGLLYLIVGVCGGFSQLVVRNATLVAGDASATADHIRASATTFQIGFAADAVNITAFILLAFALYVLLSPVSRLVAASFVVLNAIAVAVMGVSLIGHGGALAVATDPSYATALGADAADALALLLMDLHGYGYLIAEIFFGLWLLPLGYVVYRSSFFPRVLGIALMVGSAGYLASFAVTVSSPGFQSGLSVFLALPAGLAEIAFLLWLLVRGVRVEPRDRPTPVTQPAAA